jgi:hypothetical protein
VLSAFLSSLAQHWPHRAEAIGELGRHFALIAQQRPDLGRRAHAAEEARDSIEIEKVFREALGYLEGLAKSGETTVGWVPVAEPFSVDFLSMWRALRFDHLQHRVVQGYSTTSAPIFPPRADKQ